MKLFSYQKRRRVISIALCTVMISAAAVKSVFPTGRVYAEESSQPDSYLEGDDLNPKDNLEEYVIYRWKAVTSSTMPGENDDDWHLAMLFRVWKGEIEGPYMNGKVTERLYLGTNPKYTPQGYDRNNILRYQKGSPGWDKIEENDVAESTTHYLKNKYVYGYNDKTVNPYADVFYTADDRDCISVRKVGISTYRKNADGLGAFEYEIKFKSSNEGYDYYAWGNVDNDNDANMWALTEKDSEALAKTMKDNNYNEDYSSTNRFCFIDYGKISSQTMLDDDLFKCGGYGAIENFLDNDTNLPKYSTGDKDTWNVVGEIDGHDPWLWMSGTGQQDNTWWYFRDKKTDDSRFLWYNGEKLRYSAFRSSFSLKNHQVMSITKSTYIDDTGSKEAQQGVILPKGKSITVNKGCVLSVSGSFINNGTIIVNGGTLIIKDGGTIYPFLPGTNPAENGCGSIRCLNGDIIIEKGGALYAGLTDQNGSIVDFNLDNNSTLINQGLLVYGNMRLGQYARVELYENSTTYGGYYQMAMKIKKTSGVKSGEEMQKVKAEAAENGYSVLTEVQNGSDKSSYDIYFDKRARLTPDEMLFDCNENLTAGHPEKCAIIYDCFANLEVDNLDMTTDEVIPNLFGMRTASENFTIKVAGTAKFNDGFASANPKIAGKITELKL